MREARSTSGTHWRGLVLLLLTTALAASAAGAGFTANPQSKGLAQAGQAVRLEGPRTVFVRDLPPAAAVGQAREVVLPRRASSQADLEPVFPPAGGNAHDSSFSPQPASPPGLSGVGFEGLDNSDNQTLTGVTPTPPDSQVAVGPAHVFEMVNIVGRIYTRTGGSLQTFTLASFFGVPPGYLDTDPKLIYDALSGRWFASYVSLIDQPGQNNDQSRLHLAISQTSDPTGAWNMYFISYAQLFPDYEGIGVTNDKFTISSNVFDIDQPFYYGAETLVLEKADVLAGAPGPSVGLFAFPRRLDRFTVRPAQSLSSGNDQYLVTRNAATTLTVIKITGTPDAANVTEASATNLPMLAQNAPPASVALGGNIDSGDSRLLDAMWRDGRLWTSASAACVPSGDSTTRSCAHMIEVNAGVTPPLIAQDIMFGAPGEYYSWPALRTDATSDLYVSLTHTNAAIFAEARSTGRLASDPPNTMSGSALLRAGDVFHDSSRWGDYLGAAVDPLFPDCVWLVGEYAKDTAGENWGTFIRAASFSDGCDSDNDGWSDGAEAIIGTNAALNCGVNAWPADINNDTFVDTADLAAVTGSFGLSIPPAPPRYSVAPDPPDAFVDTADIARLTGLFGLGCT